MILNVVVNIRTTHTQNQITVNVKRCSNCHAKHLYTYSYLLVKTKLCTKMHCKRSSTKGIHFHTSIYVCYITKLFPFLCTARSNWNVSPEPSIFFAYRSSRVTLSSFEKWHLQSPTFPLRMKFAMCLYLLRFTAGLFFISSNVTFWHTLFIISSDELIPRKALIWPSASWIRSSNCMNSILGLAFSAHHARLKSNQSP